MTETKTLNEPSTRKIETRRKQAIQKVYQYLGIPSGITIRLPAFRAKLINEGISYQQMRKKSGLSDKAIRSVSEACEYQQWDELLLRVRILLNKVWGFTDADFVTKAYTVDEANWVFVEPSE
jgi:hypothetical protein